MKIILMSALALSVFAGGVASAQTYDHNQGPPGVYQPGYDRDGGGYRDYDHRHHRHCFWRHHHRVCR